MQRVRDIFLAERIHGNQLMERKGLGGHSGCKGSHSASACVPRTTAPASIGATVPRTKERTTRRHDGGGRERPWSICPLSPDVPEDEHHNVSNSIPVTRTFSRQFLEHFEKMINTKA